MSSETSTKNTNHAFISRLVELCGSDEPAIIRRKLGVDYQSAKNYLLGRKPNAEVLEKIVEVTNVSLNWLLMGQGAKYLKDTFDLERTIDLHDDWRDVLSEWYEYEGRPVPDTLGASFMGGWKSLNKKERVAAITDYKNVLDRLTELDN